jgi:hypothetical protein
MSIVLLGSTSGSCTLQEQAVAGNTTLTLPTFNGTVGLLVSGTSVSASGTSVDFTGLPAGVRRITVMFNEVSTNGTSNFLVQLGDSGGIENTGYISTGGTVVNTGVDCSSSTAGFLIRQNEAAQAFSGHMMITQISGNIFISSHNGKANTSRWLGGGGSKTVSDTLTQVRITTVNGTDTFDAGTINILYE